MTALDGARKVEEERKAEKVQMDKEKEEKRLQEQREKERILKENAVKREIERPMRIIAEVADIPQKDTYIKIRIKYIEIMVENGGEELYAMQTHMAYTKLNYDRCRCDDWDSDLGDNKFQYYRDHPKHEKVLLKASTVEEIVDYLATEVGYVYPSKAEEIDNALANMDAHEERMAAKKEKEREQERAELKKEEERKEAERLAAEERREARKAKWKGSPISKVMAWLDEWV